MTRLRGVALLSAVFLLTSSQTAQARQCAVTSLHMMNELRIMMRDAPGTMMGLGACLAAGSSEYHNRLKNGHSYRVANRSARQTFGICALTVCLFAGDGCFTVAERSIALKLRADELKAHGC